MAYVIGVDGGTEGLRASVFDLEGRRIGTEAVHYDTHFAPGARAEQTPEDWWQAMGGAVRGALAKSGIAADAIEALCADTTCCTVVALDAQARPLRPAIIWMDVRAGAEADAVLATGDAALAINGAGRGPVSAEWMIPKSLWLSRHEPELFAAAHTICEYQDYINWRLTGRRCASLNNVSVRWHYATTRGGWPESLLSKLGLDALLGKWPTEVLAPGAAIGRLTAEAAAHLGLPASVTVVQGGADADIGVIGLGVRRPGQLALITGSSHLQFAVGEGEAHVPGLFGSYPDAIYPGRSIMEGGQTSTGSIVAWLRRFIGDSLDLDALNREAAKLAPGADGLVVQDHFQGNRTPHTDPLSRGAITGLTLAHTPAHVFRAIMEGVGFGNRAIIDRMSEAGFGADEITVGGGATRSDLWLQIHADTARLPVVVPEVADAPLLGCAILAAHGIGHFASIDDGIAAMVRPGRRIEPDPGRVAQYRRDLPPLCRALPRVEGPALEAEPPRPAEEIAGPAAEGARSAMRRTAEALALGIRHRCRGRDRGGRRYPGGARRGRRIQRPRFGQRAVFVEAVPASGAILVAALGDVDAAGAIQHGLDLLRLSVIRPHADQGAAAPDALGIDMRVLLAMAGAGQRPEQPAGARADAGAGDRCNQPAGGDHRSDAGDCQCADAGEQAGAATDDRADRCAGPRAGAAGRRGVGGHVGPCLGHRAGRGIEGAPGTAVAGAAVAADDADVGMRDAGILQQPHRAGRFVVAVVQMRDRACHGARPCFKSVTAGRHCPCSRARRRLAGRPSWPARARTPPLSFFSPVTLL